MRACALLGALLAATPARAQDASGVSFAGVSFQAVETAAPNCTTGAGMTAAGIIARWSFEEDTTAQRVSGGSCGTTCNLSISASGSIPKDTSIFQEGTASNNWIVAEADYLSCADATCGDAIEQHGSSDRSMTWGGRVYKAAAIDAYFIDKMGATSTGFEMSSPSTSFQVSAENKQLALPGGTIILGSWMHLAGTFDDASNLLKAWVNATPTTCSDCPTTISENTEKFGIGYSGTAGSGAGYGRYDEFAILAGAKSAAFMCYWCSCLLNGALCKYRDTTWTTVGVNGDQCGTCTLPTTPASACSS